MPKVTHESPGKIRRRGRALIYHRGPLAKISHQKWPLEIGDGGHSIYGNMNYLDMDTIRMHRIQQDRISVLNVTEGQILFRRVQGYVSRRPQGNNLLPTYDRFLFDLDVGEFGCHCVPEIGYRCSPSPCPEVILARNLSEKLCPFQGKLGSLYDDSIGSEHLSGSLPNPTSRAECPCFSQHKCTTNETANFDKSLYSIYNTEKDLPPVPLIECQTSSIPKKEENRTGKLPDLENLESSSTGGLREVERNYKDHYEDQHFSTSIERQGVPAAQSPQPWGREEDPAGKVSQSKQTIQSDNGGGCPRKRWLACPWYKKDPVRYSSCAKYKLLRIKDVKQHTYRRHMKPTVYCSVCFRVFSREKERDRHMQKKTCTPRSEPEFDGLSEQQRKELNQSANRGKDDTERWYCMWDTIFPGERRPLLPYLGVGRQELLPLLRSFWNQRHQEIIRNVLQGGSSQREIEPEIVQNVMDTIFDRFEAESLIWDSYPNEHSGDDESSETSNPRAQQSPVISNDITIEDSPSQQDITDYGTLYEPSGNQLGLEPDLSLEHISDGGFNEDIYNWPQFDLSQNGRAYPYGNSYST
ncbi:hypothetical protein F5Y00DRAFT_268735 [Daldinia vernicosa]|uniref:uncharacterized protein n=1 Tax=Daldinia vernicosa TaxID=114800 RepID=UPI002007386A|nr:uncharacterized protein F5Y00DRAFT_268735 [Daldinia vernicosa]KAI0849958.1 hypothetical protein F5Y00DRAFT_268735 [Daldinia vernicosa]